MPVGSNLMAIFEFDKKYEDGVIVVCDDNDEPLEKLFFEQAACVGLEIEYVQEG